jgi:hypothetical protein
MRKTFFSLILLMITFQSYSQFTFELSVDYAMRVGNTDQFSLSGTIQSGRIEKGKTYFTENGAKIQVLNIISSKSATSVPVAVTSENVSMAITCEGFDVGRGDIIRAMNSRPSFSSNLPNYHENQLPEGILSCRLNGKVYRAKSVSKPVYIKKSNILDLFFIGEDESVIWLQINGFSDIEMIPHHAKSDTSEKSMSMVCKVAYMPKGYRPTDLPNHYKAYEDLKGNSGIIITSLNRYKRNISLEFSGILRPNKRLLEDGGEAGLFYMSEGRVDSISWDPF